MIVCCCHAVNDRDYASACLAARERGDFVEEHSPAGTCCGGCHGTLEEIRAQIAKDGKGRVPERCPLALVPTPPHKPGQFLQPRRDPS